MGMDIMGVLLRVLENKKFLLATINYFIKWIKLESVVQITEVDVIKFKRNNILSQFGIAKAFVSDNKTQFVGHKFKTLLDKLKIEFYISTSSYP